MEVVILQDANVIDGIAGDVIGALLNRKPLEAGMTGHPSVVNR